MSDHEIPMSIGMLKCISSVFPHMFKGLLVFTCMTTNKQGYDYWRTNYNY